MPRLIAFALTAALLGLAPHAVEAEEAASPVVVELFTSQGCSSCPPADALLGDLAERDDVVALSHHVDYWDYIGWKDPFARPEATERQRAYSRVLQLSFIYTPQMVIDGRYDVVGSRRGQVISTIGISGTDRKPAAVEIDAAGGRIVIAAGDRPAEPCSVYLAFYDRSHETDVERGENHGRKLVNTNVVRSFEKIGIYDGARLELAADFAAAEAAGRGGAAVLVQTASNGRIMGAAKVDF